MRADLVVVGAGHAGCEAAAAAARLGLDVIVLTLSLASVGRLSCNPAIGGLGKGHLVRELDALGGLMARAADATCLQFRQLNTSRGLAVRSSRVQVDVDAYPRALRGLLTAIPNLHFVEGEATALRVAHGRVTGVQVGGDWIETPRVILTTGTFLTGVMHRGHERTEGGRIGEAAAVGLSRSLQALGIPLSRLKTGTVPRVHKRSVAWDRVPEQNDVVPDGRLSFARIARTLPPVRVHVTATNEAVHALVRSGLAASPLYSGAITGVGPRYCPSLEDKVVRFADRDRHLLFLEPEGHESPRVYVAGLSTSLPVALQDAILHAIPGLEHAEVLQHGYAVEYDVADPTALDAGLGHREIGGLWLAGQVNGTSGYEEAAVQGFVAGVSAARGEPLALGRDQAYIGVLVDDLVSKGIGGEPYRMFTSRAEHRLLLREDNADRRLMPMGRALGLVDDLTWRAFEAREEARNAAYSLLDTPLALDADMADRFVTQGLGAPRRSLTRREVLRRPEASWTLLQAIDPTLPTLEPDVAEQLEIDVRFEGYIHQAARRAGAAVRLDRMHLPDDVPWSAIPSLSAEASQRLARARPRTLGQARRLPGITPAAITAVAAWLATRTAPPAPSEPAAP